MKRYILLQMLLSAAGWVILIVTLIITAVCLIRWFRNREKA